MSYTWYYGGQQYESEADADAGVLALRERLESNPTDWVVVKELSGNASDGWVLSAITLSDSEINNLDDTKNYNVSAVINGDNNLGLSASEATSKISQHRDTYADYLRVNTIVKVQEYSPQEGFPHTPIFPEEP